MIYLGESGGMPPTGKFCLLRLNLLIILIEFVNNFDWNWLNKHVHYEPLQSVTVVILL